MRKTVLYFLAICSFSLTVNGQFFDLSDSEATGEPLISKGGHNILPEKGDIGLGINATPFLDFAGNLIKINSGGPFSSPLHMQPPEGGVVVFLKYYTGTKTALRVKFSISYDRVTDKTQVADDINAGEFLYDTRIRYWYDLDVGIGLEKRRGATRLQGFYGLEGFLTYARGSSGVGNENYRYKHANEFSSTNTFPTSTYTVPGQPGVRYIYEKQPSDYGIGGRAFLGVEYFILPKIAIGGELAFQLEISRSGAAVEKTETWVANDVEKTVTKDKTPSGSDIRLYLLTDTHLYLVLHF